jgi:16S rRNA (guanine966-N2)-methyltransferase
MTRVIAGTHRGRRLKTPPPRDLRTRPTSDRSKTVLFDLLGPIAGMASVLDLFAGTGALGIEALSRGVERATFVETQTKAVGLIEENLELFRLRSISRVVKRDALDFVINAGAVWSLILADPPYECGLAVGLLAALSENDALEPGGWFAVEHEPGLALPERSGTLSRTKHRRVGSTELTLYRETRGGSG